MKRKLQKEKMAQKCKFSANCSFSSKMLDYKLNSSVMYKIKWSDRKNCNFIKKIIFQETSPHFLWSHTWMNASLDFFCAVSSGQPVICLKSLASICVLTGTFWKWPRGIVIPQRSWDVPACTGDGMGSIAWLNGTYIHVLDIHICFPFQFSDELSVKLLEL